MGGNGCPSDPCRVTPASLWRGARGGGSAAGSARSAAARAGARRRTVPRRPCCGRTPGRPGEPTRRWSAPTCPGRRPSAHRPAAHRARDGGRPTGGSAFLDRALQRHVRFPQVTGPSAATWAGRVFRRRASTHRCGGPRRLGAERLPCGSCAKRGSPAGCSATPSARGGWTWRSSARRLPSRWTAGRGSLRRGFRPDRRKQNALVRDGLDPLRFTWHDLDGRPDEVVAETRDSCGTRPTVGADP